MPQISLKISNNIDMHLIDWETLFAAIHEEMGKIPNLNVNTCHSGVIQEGYSYIGFGDVHATRVYLEVLWLENSERAVLKKELAKNLMKVLENLLRPQIVKQGLGCIPRVRVGNLGVIDFDYHISELIA